MARLELVISKKELYDIAEEYYNSIRTNIQFSGRDLKVITLTSVQPGYGGYVAYASYGKSAKKKSRKRR